MGIIRRIFGGDSKGGESQEVELDLGEALQRIEDGIAEKESLFVKERGNIVSEIMRQKELISGILEDLRDLEFDEDIKDRTYKPIITSKPIYVKTMLDALRNMRKKEIDDYPSILDFYNAFSKTLQTLSATHQKKGRYMSFAFPKEMQSLGRELNQLIDQVTRLGNWIEEMDKDLDEWSKAKSGVELLKKDLDSHKQVVEEKRAIKKRILEKESLRADLDKKLKELEHSSEYKDYRESHSHLEALSRERRESITELKKVLQSLGRPLRKYEKKLLQESGGLAGKINSYQTDFEKTLLEEGRASSLPKILDGLGKAMESGELKLKEKDLIKTRSRLKKGQETLKKGLEGIWRKEALIQKNEEELAKKHKVIKSWESHKKEIEKTESEIEALEKDLTSAQEPESHDEAYKGLEDVLTELLSVKVRLKRYIMKDPS